MESSDPQTLYSTGWRQGTIFRAELVAAGLVLDEPGTAHAEQRQEHGCWVVASQDCDLAAASLDNNEPEIEIRPVIDDASGDWGIRSRKLRLDATRSTFASGLPLRVSPALLNTLVKDNREPPLDDARALAFKTWLGLRFDRPAVPEHLVPLAQDVARRLRRPGGRAAAAEVHEVLMQFDESTSPPGVLLFAVVAEDTDREAVRLWLADAALVVPADLGIVVEIDVGTKAETSLELIETSYAADASQITWPDSEPTGAA